MKKIKFMLVALMAVFGFNNAMADELVGSTQYDTNGFQYVIKSLTKGTDDVWTGTVSVKKNDFSGTAITINPTVNITVEGTVDNVACVGTVAFDIVEIEAGGFAGLSSVTSITFAAGCKIEEIGEGAFAGTKIENLDLTNTQITVLNKLFENANTSLKSVALNADLVTVAPSALEHCYALGTINADACIVLKNLGAYCFGDNVVEELDLSNTVIKTLENNPFVGGTPIEEGGETISGAKNKTLKTLVLPSTVNIAKQGLANLYNLESVNLEDTKIEAISELAFENDAKLTALTFPGTLKFMRQANAFKGCASLATLTINYDKLQEVGPAEGNLFAYATDTEDEATLSALKTLKFVTTSTTDYDFKAKFNASAFSNCLGITTVEIAKGDNIAATATLAEGAIALSNEENSSVTFGNLSVAPAAGFITGPTATGVEATVTFGAVKAAQAQTAGIVSGNLATVTFGKLEEALCVEAIGLASKIVFGGEIAARLTVTEAGEEVGRVVNSRLTEIDFGSIEMTDGAIIAAAFDEENAPNLIKLTWTPADNDAVDAFATAAFGTESKGNAAKVELYTTTDVASLYEFDEANLWNVIFKAAEEAAEAVEIPVYGPDDAVVFVGYFNNNTGSNYSIEKKQGNAIITVYSAFVDDSDNKIYMDPLMIVDGKFVVDAGQTVVVRSTTSDKVLAYATNDHGTMRYAAEAIDDEEGDDSGEGGDEPVEPAQLIETPINALQYTATAISADQLGTMYYDLGQYVYYLMNPVTATGINFARLGATQYLYAGAVYIVKAGTTASRLEVVWLDESEATAIQSVKTIAADKGAIFNLAGQKVDASYKGIVIKNGKKMIQK